MMTFQKPVDKFVFDMRDFYGPEGRFHGLDVARELAFEHCKHSTNPATASKIDVLLPSNHDDEEIQRYVNQLAEWQSWHW